METATSAIKEFYSFFAAIFVVVIIIIDQSLPLADEFFQSPGDENKIKEDEGDGLGIVVDSVGYEKGRSEQEGIYIIIIIKKIFFFL